MTYFRTGDPEPGPDVDVLINEQRGQTRYLARLQHGWVWVNGKRELDRPERAQVPTPLTWKYAVADHVAFADAADADPTELRTLTDIEVVEWRAS